jgi:dipeptidyl aminopeptidase/acylaminoacyl peptidase
MHKGLEIGRDTSFAVRRQVYAFSWAGGIHGIVCSLAQRLRCRGRNAGIRPGSSQPPTDGAKEEKSQMGSPAASADARSTSTSIGTWMDVMSAPTEADRSLRATSTPCRSPAVPTRIAEGLPFEMQPQFSPDGKRIAFTSDRGGGDNIWVMNVDGSDKRPLTKEEFRLLNEPSWSPDGRFIAARKHFTTARSLGTGEIWIYHVGGGGGYVAVKKASDSLQKELGEPVYAPDGKSIYYTRNVSPGNTFEYAQDSNGSLFEIERCNSPPAKSHGRQRAVAPRARRPAGWGPSPRSA